VTTPRITAVVVVHGSSAEQVAACVDSLLRSEGVDVFVVLVDNASPDGGRATRPWMSRDRVSVVHSARNDGFAAGVNQGLARRRRGDLIWLINDDATVAPTALATCAAMLGAHPGAIAVAPRVMLANEPDRVDSIGVVLRPNGEAFNAFIGQRWAGQVSNGDEVLGPCFGAALFRSDAFDANVVGTIDERYRLYYEDVDWDLRARRAGLRTVAAVDAVVMHQHAASTRLLGEAARYELVQRNLLLCATKNFTLRRAAAVWGGRLIVHAKGVVKGPYRLQRVRSLLRGVVGAPSALLARRTRPRPAPGYDELTDFAFADGMSPMFDPETYRAT
jgi:GT2 family glycosyltransferase